MKQKLISILKAIIAPFGRKGENTTGGGNVRPTETNMLVSNDFILIILDTFSLIGNQDTVIGAEIESGFVSKNAEVELVGIGKEPRKLKIGGIEKKINGKMGQINTATVGDRVGILLRGISKKEIEIGQFLVPVGSMKAVNQFSAKLMFNDKSFLENKEIEGTFYCLRNQTPATINLYSDAIDANGYVNAHIILKDRFPLRDSISFEFRKNGKLVASGIVAEVKSVSLYKN
ncbi:MAG TPA: hypothetical protein PK566_08565 [Pseudobacteroides sp.]|nr:hypothetical protein [Pseudobacteroides sp.]